MSVNDDYFSPHVDVLPDSRTRDVKGRVSVKGTTYVPIFCANCGKSGGGVPEEHITFCFYLCDPCSEKWGPIANTYVEPDAVFFEKVKQAQIEEYGRQLSGGEIVRALDDVNHKLQSLAREAPKGR